jgi:hypothetical protein
MSLPIRHAFAASSPRVAFSPFHQFHTEAFLQMIGRAPSAFERATADALWSAYLTMPTSGKVHAFTALSAATGAGKTTSACALMAYLADQGLSCAYVAPSIAVAEEVHRHLLTLTKPVSSKKNTLDVTFFSVACYSSVHKANASPRTLDTYADQGVTPSAQYTEDQFKAAQIVITTHERWRHELTTEQDLGVLRCNGKERALVVVDEEPELDQSLVRQPEDVSALASLLADVEFKDEARAFGFTSAHHAAASLLSIHGRMRDVKDNAAGHYLQSSEVVTAEELEHIEGITVKDVAARVMSLGVADYMEAIEFHNGTVEFLKLAAQGRVFYSRERGGAFYAYGLPVRPRPRHLILDGTADLNGFYAVGKHVSVVSAVPANYGRVNLYAVQPPRQFRDGMRDKGVLRNDTTVRDYLKWFLPFLLERTEVGQHVLVYCKKRLLEYGVHKGASFDDSGDRRSRYVSTFQGRTIHWCNFGRGRGLNEWKHCTAYFRLGDFVLKRAVMLSRVAATTGETYSPADLKRLNSWTVRDARLKQAEAAHLATNNKQDSARICIRHLDDDGHATAASLFMVDCDLDSLVSYRERMFPGSKEYTVLTCNDSSVSASVAASAKPKATPKDGAAARVANLILTTELTRLTVADLQERCGLRPDNYTRTLATAEVRDAMSARGWTEVTRKSLGLSGKGKLLVRPASA